MPLGEEGEREKKMWKKVSVQLGVNRIIYFIRQNKLARLSVTSIFRLA
jgi:hypothetical protein